MAQQAEGGRRGAQETGEAGRRATREAAEGTKRGAHAATDTMRSAAQEAVERGRDSMVAAAEIYNETAQLTAEDLQAIAALSSIAAGGLAEMRQAWMDWLGRSLRTTTRTTQLLLRVKSIDEFADLQRSFLKESFDNLLESGMQMLRISGRVSEDARRPIEDRVSQARSGEKPQPEEPRS